MKKIFCALFLALVCFSYAWGGGTTTTYYATLKAQVSSASSGMGKVYAGTSTTAGTFNESSSTSESQNSTTKDAEKTFYALAQANDGYVFSGWSNTDGGSIVSKDSPYSVKVKCSSSNSGSPTTTTIYAIFKQAEDITVTLQANDKCTVLSATYGSSNLSAGSTSSAVPSSTSFALNCAPATGYKVCQWWYEIGGQKTYFGIAQNSISSYLFPKTCTVGVDVVSVTTPMFQIKGKELAYTSLNDANKAAVNGDVIELVSDGTLTSGEYTIKSGVTLFIPPYNYKGNVPTTQPDAWCKHSDRNGTYNKNLSTDNSKDMSEVDRHLTLDNGVILTINGILATGGARWLTVGNTGQTTTSGDFRMDTKYGLISLNSGSSIILNSGSKLYCWGRIRGDGSISAKSGSQVYESFVYMDHRELEAFGEIANGKKVFIMNQYYVQDIQAPITFESGAQETLATAFFHYSTSAPATGSFSFIGTSSSNSLFEIPSKATLTKRYNVDKDRLEFDLNNGVNINQIKITISSVGTYSTSNNILTITNNWSLNVLSGTTNIQQSLHFAPGAELNISTGAIVNVASGKTLSVYDKNDWGLFACNNTIIPLYLPSYELKTLKYYDNAKISHPQTKIEAGNGTAYDAIRTKANLRHATILVNGTLNMNGGLYTTFSGTANDGRGANICSDGGGIIKFNAVQGSSTTITELFGCARNTTVPQTTSVNVQAALLHDVNNNDPANTTGTYTSTAGAAANTTYKYVASISKWGKVSTVTFKDGDATIQSTQLAEGEAITTPTPEKSGYKFLGWDKEVSVMGATDVTYNAVWEKQITSLDIETEQVITNGDTKNPEGLTNHTYTVEENIAAQTVVVNQGSTLQIEESNQVTATTLVLKTTPSAMDNLENDGKAGASCQIKGEGTLNATNVYIDITMDPSGKLDGSKYYAFAVPFTVNVNGGVQKKIGNVLSPCIHDTHYRAYTYDGANRAAYGKGGNWIKVDNNGTFEPGIFYLVEFADGSCNTFRFTKASGDLNNAAIINLAENGNNIPDSPDAGWNGIANNSLQNATIELSDEGMAQVFDPAQSKFIQVDLSQTTFAIGTPLFVQVGGADWTASNSAVTQNPSPAPSRMLAQNTVETFGKYIVRIKAEGAAKMADQMFISASENAQTNYVIGKDMVKMFLGNSTAAQLWVNDYGKKLSANQTVLTNDVAVASLTLYAPAAGNYTVYLKDIPEDATIYLLQNGQAIANLNDGAFTVSLAKGENTLYGLRINAIRTLPGVVTSIDEALIKGDLQKVLLNGVVYIVRDGKLYNVLGQQR